MATETLVHPQVKKVLLSEDVLRARIRELGAQITRDYPGKRLTVVAVPKGSVVFLADLLREIGPRKLIVPARRPRRTEASRSETDRLRSMRQ